ncbi:MAG: DUF2127 domain-containing protein [bacterium]
MKEKYIYEFFELSILLKAINAVIEIILGLIIFFITQDFIHDVITFFTSKELIEDPTDLFANYFFVSGNNFAATSHIFIIIYLLVHGVIKLILMLSLFKNKLWAYPLSIIFFSLFIFYQIYRFTYTHSLWLILFTIFDILVVWLVWHEYISLKKNAKSI